MKFKPHDYQAYAIKRIEENKSVGLLLDMGLGKTVITLTAISNLLALDEVHKVLVIAPLQTALNTWTTEQSKWEHLDNLSISLVLGPANRRFSALSEDADVYVINRENVQWLCEQYPDRFPFDMVVIDELSSFKSASAKRFKHLKKKMPFVKRVVGLTGTPSPNGYMDLWSEMYLLDRGERLGKTIGMYKALYFKPAKMNGHIVYEWKLTEGAKEVIDKKLADLCISMKAVDFLKMPERIETEVFVQMTDKERKLYDRLGKDNVLPEHDVVGVNAAALQNKLLQLSSGFLYDEEKNIHNIHEHKLEALTELVEAAQDKPLLVYYNFIADKEKILKAFPEAVELKGSSEVKKWNEKKIKMLIAHPASAGHGLNLQEGGNIIVWYGLPWSLELYQQANARLYRQGQKETVYIYYIMTKNTHDEDVLAALRRKDMSQEELLKALKARIKKWS